MYMCDNIKEYGAINFKKKQHGHKEELEGEKKEIV